MLNAISGRCQTALAVRQAKLFYMESFKSRMKRIRLRAGYASQDEAAQAIGCKRGTVSMWEAPSSEVSAVGGEYLLATAKAYKVRPEWINDLQSTDDGYIPDGGELSAVREPSAAYASQPARIDEEILVSAIENTEALLTMTGMSIPSPEVRARIVTIFYREMTQPSPNPTTAVSAALAYLASPAKV